MGKKTKGTWVVTDTDGSEYTIVADGWAVGCEGLKFFLEDERIAHFVRWANYRKNTVVKIPASKSTRYELTIESTVRPSMSVTGPDEDTLKRAAQKDAETQLYWSKCQGGIVAKDGGVTAYYITKKEE